MHRCLGPAPSTKSYSVWCFPIFRRYYEFKKAINTTPSTRKATHDTASTQKVELLAWCATFQAPPAISACHLPEWSICGILLTFYRAAAMPRSRRFPGPGLRAYVFCDAPCGLSGIQCQKLFFEIRHLSLLWLADISEIGCLVAQFANEWLRPGLSGRNSGTQMS